VLYADDTILITTSPNSTDFIKGINGEFTHIYIYINNKSKANSSLESRENYSHTVFN